MQVGTRGVDTVVVEDVVAVVGREVVVRVDGLLQLGGARLEDHLDGVAHRRAGEPLADADLRARVGQRRDVDQVGLLVGQVAGLLLTGQVDVGQGEVGVGQVA